MRCTNGISSILTMCIELLNRTITVVVFIQEVKFHLLMITMKQIVLSAFICLVVPLLITKSINQT